MCGSNGITYVNAQVAACQGIAVAALGVCATNTGGSAAVAAAGAAASAGTAFPPPQALVGTATVSLATLSKYSVDGYSFVARVKLEAQGSPRQTTAAPAGAQAAVAV